MSPLNKSITERLTLDWADESQRITDVIRRKVSKDFKKRGLVVALSGGIDSSTCAALAAHAVGPENVIALLMPERHSSEDTLALSQRAASAFGIKTIHQDITDTLSVLGCYQLQEDTVKQVIPEFDKDWKFKINIPNILDEGSFRLFSIVAQSPDGRIIKARLPANEYLQIVAATNFKQRVRRMYDYYHADRLNYAVIGTPNRLEYDQGFFVKLGDGTSDIKPIAHLYKTQVYALAAQLGVPDEILTRSPTTDTYSLAQSQEEFYFSLPYNKMDICLYGLNNSIPTHKVADEAELTLTQLEYVYRDIEQKRRTTRYLHLHNILVEPIPEIQ